MTSTLAVPGAPALHAVVHDGGGVPVVLSHALGLDLSMWDAVAATLAGAHPLLRYDHRGHGASAALPGPWAIDDLVGDAARVVHAWGRGAVLFVGLSLGGMVAQGLGIRHPRLVRGLVLANTLARYPDDARPVWDSRIAAVEAGGVAAVADAAVERWLTPAFRASSPHVVAALHRRLAACDAAAYVAACHAVAGVDWLDGLGTISCLTLVIAGALDAGAPPALARAMAERIAGAELVVWEDCAHLSAVERPQRFADAVAAFAARL